MQELVHISEGKKTLIEKAKAVGWVMKWEPGYFYFAPPVSPDGELVLRFDCGTDEDKAWERAERALRQYNKRLGRYWDLGLD